MPTDRPKFRHDIELTLREDGETIIVSDPILELYQQVGLLERATFEAFDGTRTCAEVAAKISDAFEVDLDAQTVESLARNAEGLLLLDVASDLAIPSAVGKRIARAVEKELARDELTVESLRSALTDGAGEYDEAVRLMRAGKASDAARALDAALARSPGQGALTRLRQTLHRQAFLCRRPGQSWFSYRIPLFNPSRVLAVLNRRVGFLVNPVTAVVGLLWLAFAALGVLARSEELVRSISIVMQNPGRQLWLLLPFFIADRLFVAGHELSHGLACVHHGGRVREVGLLFRGYTMGAYCDVSAAHTFTDRWKRVSVSLGGPVWNVYALALFTTGYLLAEPGTPSAIFLLLMMASKAFEVGLSLLPFYKDDFYYAISDAARVNNLLDKATGTLKSVLARTLLGIEIPAPEVERHERRVVYSYGTLNIVFTIYIVLKSAVFFFGLLVIRLQGIGVVLFIVMMFMIFGRRVLTLGRFIHQHRKTAAASRRFRTNAAVTAVAMLALPFAPVSEELVVDCKVALEGINVVAPASGQVLGFDVSEGDLVEPGQRLAQLKSRAVEDAARECQSRFEKMSADLELATVGLSPARRGSLLAARRSAQIAFQAARTEQKRIAAMTRSGLATAQERTTADLAMGTASANLHGKDLAALKANEPLTEAQVQALEGSLLALREQCDELQRRKSSLMLEASEKGRVLFRLGGREDALVSRPVREGEVLVRIAREVAPRIELALPSHAVDAWVKPGGELEVRLAGAPDVPMAGVVESIASKASVGATEVTSVVRLRDASLRLSEGAACRARFHSGREPLFKSIQRDVAPVLERSFWQLW